ncbi:sorting and assembly machinery component 50 homolog B isoform X2 [Halyomorpha halys]|uniref:sorting and assembly machinery component 50 homolog B isoform X2 n=1 Tax=Halyomorpha halys TaxID=286706 RepID=UPI0006D4EFDE|nr:sorting and assembly machinery component 50 homolog B isoform X2 [Halyomorpha halys]
MAIIKKAHGVRQKLLKLGCFKSIAIHIDTSSGPAATPSGFEVNYEVSELKRITGGISTNISNSGEGIFSFGGIFPNLWGRGESIKGDMSYGSGKSNTANISIVKPFISPHNLVGSLSAVKSYDEPGSSGYKLFENALIAECGFTSFPGWNHKLQYEASWRLMGADTKQTSFFVRNEAGSTLKSSVRHVWNMDSRNSTIFPTCGRLMQMTTEFAGLGGNVNFLKNEVRFQKTIPIPNDDVILQGGFNVGILNPIGDGDVDVIDKFFLGGPLGFRGFTGRGIGPKEGDDYIGAKMYWATGLHVYTPLPYRPGEGGVGDLFKFHLFTNIGNIGDFDFSGFKSFLEDQKNNLRFALGLGFVLKLGNMARLELNLVYPWKVGESDNPVTGLQIGVGGDFL